MREQGVETLFQAELAVERKQYQFLLCENHMGRYIRIVESSGPYGRRNAIVIPSVGLADMEGILGAMRQADSKSPVCVEPEDQRSEPPVYEADGNVFRVPLRQGRACQ
jgi:hypothetical protein